MKNIRKICCFAQCLHTYHVHRTLIHTFKEILSLHFYFDISMSRHSFSVTDEHQKLFMLMLFRIILLHIFVVPFLLDSNISLFRIFFSFFHCCVFFFLISCFSFGTFTEFFYYFNLLCSFFLYNIPLQYCRTMRDQILESFNHRDFSLMVVGNKYDLVPDTSRQSQVRIS